MALSETAQEQNCEPTEEEPCSFLDKLPPEIRLRIYELVLVYPGQLYWNAQWKTSFHKEHVSNLDHLYDESSDSDEDEPDRYGCYDDDDDDDEMEQAAEEEEGEAEQKGLPSLQELLSWDGSSACGDEHSTGHIDETAVSINTAVLQLNKQIYKEALPVFQAHNDFWISYRYFCQVYQAHSCSGRSCICPAGYVPPSFLNCHFRSLTIRHVEIVDYHPMDDCIPCKTLGTQLFEQLSGNSTLAKGAIEFVNIRELFPAAYKLTKGQVAAKYKLHCSEVGMISITSPSWTIQLVSTAFVNDWHAARKLLATIVVESKQRNGRWNGKLIGDTCRQSFMVDIVVHAAFHNLSTLRMRPYFRKALRKWTWLEDGRAEVDEFRFDDLNDAEMVGFTVALAESICRWSGAFKVDLHPLWE